MPWTSVHEREWKRANLEWRTDEGAAGPADTDSEGFVRERLPARVGPGRHVIHLRDASKRRLGTTTIRVLDPRSAPRIVKSDIDLTYLETRFETATEIARLLRTPAASHRPVHGMPALYRSLRGSLVFVSASPELFRAHLQARLALDAIPYDALRLRRIGALVARELRSGRADRVVESLRETLGDKLEMLLADRTRLPRGAREILLGDDREMDPFTYLLYREASAGRMGVAELRLRMTALGAAADETDRCVRLVHSVRRFLGDHETVAAIFIRQTGRPNARHASASLAADGIRFYRDTRVLAAELRRMGWIQK